MSISPCPQNHLLPTACKHTIANMTNTNPMTLFTLSCPYFKLSVLHQQWSSTAIVLGTPVPHVPTCGSLCSICAFCNNQMIPAIALLAKPAPPFDSLAWIYWLLSVSLSYADYVSLHKPPAPALCLPGPSPIHFPPNPP